MRSSRLVGPNQPPVQIPLVCPEHGPQLWVPVHGVVHVQSICSWVVLWGNLGGVMDGAEQPLAFEDLWPYGQEAPFLASLDALVHPTELAGELVGWQPPAQPGRSDISWVIGTAWVEALEAAEAQSRLASPRTGS